MPNNPLQKSGLIRFSDIMKEKEWVGTEAKSISQLVEQDDRLSPYVILNTYNPLSLRTNISSKPYSISDWYGYNHALSEDMTILSGTITGGNLKSMVKTSAESGSGYGYYANHYSILNTHFGICRSGSADNLSQGNTSLTVYNQFEVTERVGGSAGNYTVSVQRAYCEINLSSINAGRLIAGAEITLSGLSNPYSPCRMVLVKYEAGSTWSTAGFSYYTQISDPVSFVTGDQIFTLTASGVALINAAIASSDKYLRFGIVTYDFDYLEEAYIGNNLLSGDDYDLDTVGHWVGCNGGTTLTVENVTTNRAKSVKALKATRTEGYILAFQIANANFTSVPAVDVDYYFHCHYRFDGFPANFYVDAFNTYTWTLLNGKQIGQYSAGLNSNFIRPQDPSPKSTNWFIGHRHTQLNNPGFTNDNVLLFRVGNTGDYACNYFYMYDLRVVPILFTQIWGGKYDSPRLKYYYAGLPGGISTGSVTGVTATGATIGATISSDGYTDIIASGICWNTTGSPTIADSKTTDGNTTVSSFSSSMTGLTLGTTYYGRPYVTTEVGTSYGAQTSFTTLGLPTVTVQAATSVSYTSAVFNGTASADGGQSITDRGFVYKAGGAPTISDTKTSASTPTGTGTFTLSKTGLSAGTTYYVKAYATNASGTQLSSSSVSFTTPTNLPAVTWSAITSHDPQATYVGLNGSVTSDGGSSITDRGFVYKAGSYPTLSDNNTSASIPTGTGDFTVTIEGLTPNTTYYFSAYATNANGTTLYETFGSFTTPVGIPIVNSTTEVTNITSSSGTSGGYISYDNTNAITERGICWNTAGNPTTASSKLTSGTGTGTFSVSMTGLTLGTTYYVRCYAINSAGTAYAGQVSFTTSSASVPTVTTTSPATSVTSSSAAVSGNVNSDGGATVTAKGICYNTSGSPTTANNTVGSGSGTGSISSALTSLSASTTYYARAYAINSAGTAYGSQMSFTTQASATIPTVSTSSPATSIGASGATVEGNVSADGGAGVTEKGICYNTSGTPYSWDSKVTSGTGIGSIYSVLTGLSGGTTYYCRAYATNSQGTAYGSQISFTTTSAAAPSVTTGFADPWSSVHRTSPTKDDVGILNCEVTSDGGSTITERGVCYILNTGTPTTADGKATVSGTTGIYTPVIAGFARDGQTISYRAYAINSVGTSYGVTRTVTLDTSFWDM